MQVKKKSDFEKSLKLQKIALQLSGIGVLSKISDQSIASFFQSWLFYLNIMIWTLPERVGELYGLIDGIQSGKTFDEMAMIVPRAMVAFMGIAKSSPLYFNRHIVKEIVDKLRAIHPNDNINSDKDIKKIVNDAMKFLHVVVMLLYYLSVIVFVAFDFSPCFAMLYDYYTTGTTEFKLPFLIKYFFDPSTPTKWLIAYAHQLGSSFISCISLFSADTLFYTLCNYLQMHFRLLCHRFEDVVIEASMENTREKFRKAFKRHQELIKLVGQIELLFTRSTLYNIFMSSLLICLCGFNITFIDDIGIICSYATLLIMGLSQIFLLCYFGDMLSSRSTELYKAAYNSKWYSADENIKKNVLILMIRAQSPCKLTAMNFVDLNLPAFTTILSRSWSYFALLKTMFD